MIHFVSLRTFFLIYYLNKSLFDKGITASEIGVQKLKIGGNAIDASIATAFALAVTHPAAGNIGGGGFLVFLDSVGNATTIDFREKAPLVSNKDMFLDELGNVILGKSWSSSLASGVPGTVAGLGYAHEKYGSMDWHELVFPSFVLAKYGFPLDYFNVTILNSEKYLKRRFSRVTARLLRKQKKTDILIMVRPLTSGFEPLQRKMYCTTFRFVNKKTTKSGVSCFYGFCEAVVFDVSRTCRDVKNQKTIIVSKRKKSPNIVRFKSLKKKSIRGRKRVRKIIFPPHDF